MGLFGRRSRNAPDAGAARYREVAAAVAAAARQSSNLSLRDRHLCGSALEVAGAAAALVVTDAQKQSAEGFPLTHRCLLTADSGSGDAVARVVCALAWYYPLRMAALDEDREAQDVPALLTTLHQGLHPVESVVVVTDEDTIFDLYERSTDGARFALGMTRWLAIHLGDPEPPTPGLGEAMLIAGCLSQFTPAFFELLGDGPA